MEVHAPYHISHVYLDKQLLTLPKLKTEQQGNYLVFWWDQIALGHVFLEPDQELPLTEYLQKLAKAIEPAVNQYANSSNYMVDWQQWIVNQKPEDWAVWMQAILQAHHSQTIPNRVDISVVICTRNRASHLQRCLVMLQELKCVPVEIIVIDNAPSDDSSHRVVELFKEVLYVKEPRPGLDIARNTGIMKATSPIVAFVDDDVEVHPLWVHQVWKTFQNPNIAAMTGLVIASELNTEAQQIFEQHWSFNRGYEDKVYDSNFFSSNLHHGPPVWEIGAGANMAFRKSVFEKVGYFDELLDVGAAGCNGDSEMWYRILADGLTIYYNPRAVVYHEHRKELSGLKKQIFFYMRGFIAAALLQQKLNPQADYKRLLLQVYPKFYFLLVARGFPRFRGRSRTIWAEMKGIISGLAFYLRNGKHSSIPRNQTASAKRKLTTAEVVTN
ncbi:glycosyltransferase family 2 protein [Rufibacter tibetensis]|uniref:Glycosyltransferase 2-like domain-containing protein n=1 Tax=Rufibacter tibetensis TaxID=512763 RepID=A0A0P0CYV0_9BACT|nr:glycosyltransferase [Rufibacter tibetensis]ALI99906.1 hypothetical protein DC20_14165 [Rufibacter tibetensis]